MPTFAKFLRFCVLIAKLVNLLLTCASLHSEFCNAGKLCRVLRLVASRTSNTATVRHLKQKVACLRCAANLVCNIAQFARNQCSQAQQMKQAKSAEFYLRRKKPFESGNFRRCFGRQLASEASFEGAKLSSIASLQLERQLNPNLRSKLAQLLTTDRPKRA